MIMLKYTLLGFLMLRPTTGYDLHAHMEASTAHFWNAKLSQIYTTLKKLEADGLVESQMEAQDDRPDKRIYYITDAGRDVLTQWLETPNTTMDQVKSTLLVKLFFSGFTDLETVLAELRLQKALHEQQLHHYETTSKQVIEASSQHASDGDYHKVFWDATRQYGMRYEAMIVDWLDDTIAQLSQLHKKD